MKFQEYFRSHHLFPQQLFREKGHATEAYVMSLWINLSIILNREHKQQDMINVLDILRFHPLREVEKETKAFLRICMKNKKYLMFKL